MNVDQGVELWNQYIAPLTGKGYKTFASPATTSAPNGLDWITDFLGRNLNVQPNVITIHWYDKGVQKFKDYVVDWYNKTGQRTIWVTEYACQDFNKGEQCSEGEIWDFLKETTQWMDQTPWIGAYAPFGAWYLARFPPIFIFLSRAQAS
jgi:hypothetical protein